MYLALRNVKVSSKLNHHWLFFEEKMTEDTYRWCNDMLTWHTKHKQRVPKQAEHKQRTAHVFRWYTAYGKVAIVLLDSFNKETRHNLCTYPLKIWKLAVQKVNIDEKSKRKQRTRFFGVKMTQGRCHRLIYKLNYKKEKKKKHI